MFFPLCWCHFLLFSTTGQTCISFPGVLTKWKLCFSKWVWVKMNHQDMDRRFKSRCPFTRVPFGGYPIFDNHTLRLWMDVSWKTKRTSTRGAPATFRGCFVESKASPGEHVGVFFYPPNLSKKLKEKLRLGISNALFGWDRRTNRKSTRACGCFLVSFVDPFKINYTTRSAMFLLWKSTMRRLGAAEVFLLVRRRCFFAVQSLGEC